MSFQTTLKYKLAKEDKIMTQIEKGGWHVKKWLALMQ